MNDRTAIANLFDCDSFESSRIADVTANADRGTVTVTVCDDLNARAAMQITAAIIGYCQPTATSTVDCTFVMYFDEWPA